MQIETYAPHIMASPHMQEKLSVAELTHAQRYLHYSLSLCVPVNPDSLLRRYQAVLASHFHASVLDALPVTTHALDQRFPDGTSMSM